MYTRLAGGEVVLLAEEADFYLIHDIMYHISAVEVD